MYIHIYAKKINTSPTRESLVNVSQNLQNLYSGGTILQQVC